ncbi:MAG: Flp pilus assembly complex ATPase component TadA [Kiritimatiellae bacterium]|nr:Flp pilus assembly complex ATPase component TadA [Kiritimatiellia bacterium]
MAQRKLGQILVDLGYINDDQLWDILEEQKQSPGQVIGQVAVRMGFVSQEQVTEALAEQWGMPVVNLDETTIPSSVLELVPQTMAEIYKIMPVSLRNNVLTVAMADPQNVAALDDLRNFLGHEIRGAVSSQGEVEEAISRYYSDREESIEDVIDELSSDEDSELGVRGYDLASDEELSDAAPINKLLNMVMLLAIRDQASDIHLEPFEDEFKIRVRADGVLYEMVPPPRHLANAIVSRIKVMSDLDIAERRLPQDGRIELNVGGNPVDLRVSVMPVLFGEAVVMRILDRTVVALDLNKIGMDAAILNKFRTMIKSPNGIVLVTGPTGSGKTTTLYSALRELDTRHLNILTIEDPVEYQLPDIGQIQVRPKIGLTFADGLRHILRQDPDVILVGEIRDLETAEIAVRAALTGHLVFSTLHTNDAPSALIRLMDIGIQPYLIASALHAVMAQRLVRCKSGEASTDTYHGRTGIYEWFEITDEVRQALRSGQLQADDLHRLHAEQGGLTLARDAARKTQDGVTTDEEIRRVLGDGFARSDA